MASQPVLANTDNGVGTLLQTLFTNSGQLFGTGKNTTTTSVSGPNASVDTSNIDKLLQQLFQGADSTAIDAMIANIFDKAKTQFGPNIAQSLGAGNRALTDTTLADIQGRAIARATQEAAAAKLSAIQNTNQIAATVANAQLEAQTRLAIANATNNRVTTQTQRLSASPTGKVGSAVTTLAAIPGLIKRAKGLYDRFNATEPGASEFTSRLFGGGVSSGSFSAGGTNIGSLISANNSGELSALGVPTINDIVNPSFSDSFVNLFSTGEGTAELTGNTAAEFGQGAGVELLSGVAADAATDISIDTGADALSGIYGPETIPALGSEAVPALAGDVAGDVAVEAGTEIGLGDVLSYAGYVKDIENLTSGDTGSGILGALGRTADLAIGGGGGIGGALGNAIGDAFTEDGDSIFSELFNGEASVICTELTRVGLLTRCEYVTGLPHFYTLRKLRPSVVRGYQWWAVPYVKLMKKDITGISKLLRKIILPLAKHRISYIKGKWTVLGWVIFNILEPLCGFIGNTVARNLKITKVV